jgi:hypothetical protein
MRYLCYPLLCVLIHSAFAEEPWPDFPEAGLEERISEVSEGELEFLATPPAEPVHHHENHIRILPESLESGWVLLKQCHRHLDRVPLLEIVYHPDRIRNIRIISSRHIDHSRVIDAGVELRGIHADALICLSAESRALHRLAEERLLLRNGPYMRRFLDGYYPLHLSMEIDYPAQLLSLQSVSPQTPDAPAYAREAGKLRWEAWFRGRLYTEITFSRKADPEDGTNSKSPEP